MRLASPLLLTALVSMAFCASAVAAPPQPAVDLFSAFAQNKSVRARSEYLKAHAGSSVTGAGRLEALTPRSFYDTSVPDSDPMVALIELEPGRKAACGLPRSIMDTLGWLRDGSSVAFEGRLVDAQVWNGSTTVYLTGCILSRR